MRLVDCLVSSLFSCGCWAKKVDREQFIGATRVARGELDLPIETFSRSFWVFDDGGHVGGSGKLRETLEVSLGRVGPTYMFGLHIFARLEKQSCSERKSTEGLYGPSRLMGHICPRAALSIF